MNQASSDLQGMYATPEHVVENMSYDWRIHAHMTVEPVSFTPARSPVQEAARRNDPTVRAAAPPGTARIG
jgi:hypothetical protein